MDPFRYRGDLSNNERPSEPLKQSGLIQKSLQCLRRREKLVDLVQKENEEWAMRLFEDQGSMAYNILRKNAHTLINLLQLMVVADIKNLNDESITFLIGRLKLNKTDEEASADFKRQIDLASRVVRRRLDSVFHNVMDEVKKGDSSKSKKKT